MDEKTDDLEYEVLGFRIKLKPGEAGEELADKAIDLVCKEADKVLKRSPGLDRGEVAILVALRMACEKLDVEGEYRNNLEKLHMSAGDALQYIEEASPSNPV